MSNFTKTDLNPSNQPQNDSFKGDNSDANQTEISIRKFAVTDKTVVEYTRIVKFLVRHSEEKHSNGMGLSEMASIKAIHLVDDLIERVDISKITTKTYLAALKWYFKKNPDNLEFQEALEKLNAYQASNQFKKIKPIKIKSRNFPQNDYIQLLEDLTAKQVHGSLWAGRSVRFLRAIIACGLRPSEWEQVTWLDDEKTTLHVINSKQKKDVAGFIRNKINADNYKPDSVVQTRDVPIDRSDVVIIDEQLSMIKEFVASGKISMDVYRDNCTTAIWRSCHKLWDGEKNYSLYSARKQYSANTRAEFGADETAKRMGHSSADSPSASFYGLSNQAYSRTGAGYRKKSENEINSPEQNNGKSELIQNVIIN